VTSTLPRSPGSVARRWAARLWLGTSQSRSKSRCWQLCRAMASLTSSSRDWARANSDAAFAFARDLAAAKKPSDFIEAWTNHTTKHFEMLARSEINIVPRINRALALRSWKRGPLFFSP